jgi:Cu/Zn superoxide dismutase
VHAVSAALRPGGAFAFDVHTPARRRVADGHLSVDRSAGGFWRPHPHLVIETTYRSEGQLDLDQHTIVDEDGITTYRIWDRRYSTRQLQLVLARHRMPVVHRWSDLTGLPWSRRSPTVAVAAVVD